MECVLAGPRMLSETSTFSEVRLHLFIKPGPEFILFLDVQREGTWLSESRPRP